MLVVVVVEYLHVANTPITPLRILNRQAHRQPSLFHIAILYEFTILPIHYPY